MTKKFQNINDEHFATSDLALAAALVSKDFQLEFLDKTNPHKVEFLFGRTDEIEKTASLFWNDQLLVNPRTYFDNIKLLKNRLYAGG